MENREIALILLNMQLDMDFGDERQFGKMAVDMLEEEISKLKENNSPLLYVLENIALQNDNVTILIDGTEEN